MGEPGADVDPSDAAVEHQLQSLSVRKQGLVSERSEPQHQNQESPALHAALSVGVWQKAGTTAAAASSSSTSADQQPSMPGQHLSKPVQSFSFGARQPLQHPRDGLEACRSGSGSAELLMEQQQEAFDVRTPKAALPTLFEGGPTGRAVTGSAPRAQSVGDAGDTARASSLPQQSVRGVTQQPR